MLQSNALVTMPQPLLPSVLVKTLFKYCNIGSSTMYEKKQKNLIFTCIVLSYNLICFTFDVSVPLLICSVSGA